MKMKDLLKEDEMKSGQSKPIQMGKKVITVGLTKGTIFIYNSNMTNSPITLNPAELQLLLKMSKRKNTDEGGE